MALPDDHTGMPIMKMETEEGEGIYASTARSDSRREETNQGLTLPPEIQSSDAWRFDASNAITEEDFEALLGSLQAGAPQSENPRDPAWLHSLFNDDLEVPQSPQKRRKTKSPPRRQSRVLPLRVDEEPHTAALSAAQAPILSVEPAYSPTDSGYGISIAESCSNGQASRNSRVGEKCPRHNPSVTEGPTTVDSTQAAAPNPASRPSIETEDNVEDGLFDDDFDVEPEDEGEFYLDNNQSGSPSSSKNRDDEADLSEPLPRVMPIDPDTPIPSIEPHDPVDEKEAPPVAADQMLYDPKQMAIWPSWLRRMYWEYYWRYRVQDPLLQSGSPLNAAKGESSLASKNPLPPANRAPKRVRGQSALPKSARQKQQFENPDITAEMPNHSILQRMLMPVLSDAISEVLSSLPTPDTKHLVDPSICGNMDRLFDLFHNDPKFRSSISFSILKKLQEHMQNKAGPSFHPSAHFFVGGLEDLASLLKSGISDTKQKSKLSAISTISNEPKSQSLLGAFKTTEQYQGIVTELKQLADQIEGGSLFGEGGDPCEQLKSVCDELGRELTNILEVAKEYETRITTLEKRCDEVGEEHKKLYGELGNATADTKQYAKENERLKKENQRLLEENQQLSEKNRKLQGQPGPGKRRSGSPSGYEPPAKKTKSVPGFNITPSIQGALRTSLGEKGRRPWMETPVDVTGEEGKRGGEKAAGASGAGGSDDELERQLEAAFEEAGM
ncbi:hypothetical protein EG329_012154 [Mollisiaceae sp. DMI_Dod_QoI]|nr:hypothetical protein EG329_012154 [Helotiales sp. DMI_Dod_QoI]